MRLHVLVLSSSLCAICAAAEEPTAAVESITAAGGPVAPAATPAVPATVAPAPAADEPKAVTPALAPPSEPAPVRARWYSLSGGTHVGLGLDAGAPGGAGAVALFRPWWWLRLNGGVAYDVIGYGMRGGFTLLPASWSATPTLSVDLGHYFSGDATRFASGSSAATRALLRHAAYDFASAQVGFEFGSQRRFLFYLRGGIAYVSAKAAGNDLTALAREKSKDKSIDFTMGDATVRGVIPCFSLGFLVYVI